MSPSSSARGRGGSRSPTRGYGLTPWSRALVDVVERTATGPGGGPDGRRITKARSYFRDRHVQGLRILAGRVSASVRGSQLDPFDVLITTRPVDPATVVELLRARGSLGDVMALTRGEQPSGLGDLLVPTESADVEADCSCPDEAPRCIHVLAVTYEIAAEVDRSPTVMLTLMGTDLPGLLSEISDVSSARPDVGDGAGDADADARSGRLPSVDYWGTSASLPPLPDPPRMTPLTELDPGELRSALRASGVAATDVEETIDHLGDLYDALHDPIS
ncbi:SWIM zinc finger family protein [Gordonia soli]|uniref:SWIM-type domain-containing protein n=1 Tax=Gordonia soli NBRC 108243 TaxID=1223545 RepID=M0QCS4_9ACTN|nr:SWIM zinc finger family protein [Gordonia soli]GAC66398.1 hypothetical protein GS4_02_01090 [Gordonia soli NBRC 108243]